MRFHVARKGAVVGEFEEQTFRNKVFPGEVRPNDLYWTAGFADWRPVAEFRVARKTEQIVVDPGSVQPPPIRKLRERSVILIALICVGALVLLIIAATMIAKNGGVSTKHTARIEAKEAITHGQVRIGMTADECIKTLGQPTRIERISGSKNEQWTYQSASGPVVLHFERRAAIVLIWSAGTGFLTGSPAIYISSSTSNAYVSASTTQCSVARRPNRSSRFPESGRVHRRDHQGTTGSSRGRRFARELHR